MSKVYLISDLHFGHKNMERWAKDHRYIPSIEEHDLWLIEQWNSIVTKRDVVKVLGDVAWTREGLEKVKLLNGTKHLVMGNHDTFGVQAYMDVGFRILPGLARYKRDTWLSHAPIHPSELRGKFNIHGHVHHNDNTNDPRYYNVCVEASYGVPQLFQDVVGKLESRIPLS